MNEAVGNPSLATVRRREILRGATVVRGRVMDFQFLWVLLLIFPGTLFVLFVPYGWFRGRNSLPALSRWRRVSVVLLRIMAVAGIIVAAAGPLMNLRSDSVAVAVLVDRSASIPQEAYSEAVGLEAKLRKLAGPTDLLCGIEFGETARAVPIEGGTFQWKEMSESESLETDIGGAIDLALALLPEEKIRRILLISDGKETKGSAAGAAQRAAGKGVAIHCLKVEGAESHPDAAVVGVNTAGSLRAGEPFRLKIRIEATHSGPCNLRVTQDALLVEKQVVELEKGANEWHSAEMRVSGGMSAIEVEVIPEGDAEPGNNRYRTLIAAASPPRVLLIDPHPDRVEAFREAISGSGVSVEVRPPAGLPKSPEELEGIDLVILSDLPASRISAETAEVLSGWVRKRGGGLLLTGGENGFSAGGYRDSPMAALLPVECLQADREEDPTVALLVLLDRSGSMAAEAAGRPKIDLAVEGALMAARVLRPRDLFGLIAVDTRAQTVIPISRAGQVMGEGETVPAIAAGGGGIYIYSALAEAARILPGTAAASRHAILFADAADAEEKTLSQGLNQADSAGSALDLASAMRTSRITLSVVALGNPEDRDTGYLKDLAARGGGRFYLTADALTVPQIFTSETKRIARGGISEESFQPIPGSRAPETDGIDWLGAPPLMGLNRTLPKPGSDPALIAPDGSPLFSSWRMGLGKTAVFTSDIHNRWSREWLRWQGSTRFWIQVARSLAREPSSGQLELTIDESEDTLKPELRAVDSDGQFVGELNPVIAVTAGNQPTLTLKMSEVGPGRYAVEMDKPASDTAVFSVSTAEGERAQPLIWNRGLPGDLIPRGDGGELLSMIAAVSKGGVNGGYESLFARDQRVLSTRWLAPTAIGWVLICLLIEWAFRRLPSVSRVGGG